MKSTGKSLLQFPLSVSRGLLLVIALLFMLGLMSGSRFEFSILDKLIFNLLIILAGIAIVLWLVILFSGNFRLRTGLCGRFLKWLLFFIYYPLGIAMAFILRIPVQRYQESFLQFNNQWLLKQNISYKGKKLLLLLPHCLQFNECPARVTRDINDCQNCGKCDIGKLRLLKPKELKIGIATGGTIARKLVSDLRPDAIIAVACHRDLTDGVRESWRFPVFAVLNQRPYGPCLNTTVSFTEIENILSSLTR